MQRKHDRKKRSSAVMWSFVLTLLLIAAVAAILGIFQKPEEPPAEPVPVGTPAQAPTADQRPAPPAASVPDAASTPPEAGAPAQTDPTPSGAQQGGAVSSSASAGPAPSVPENAGQPAPAIDAKDGEQVVRGVIVDATTSSVTIQTADGTQLSFMRETADVTGRLVMDAEAEVYYVGSISGADTSAAFVTKIVAFA